MKQQHNAECLCATAFNKRFQEVVVRRFEIGRIDNRCVGQNFSTKVM